MAPDPQQASLNAEVSGSLTASAMNHRQRTKDFEKVLVSQYVNRDLLHSAAILDDQERRSKRYTHMRNETEDYRKIRGEYRQWFPPSRLYGEGYNGYGNGHTDGTTKLVYPAAKQRLGHKKTQRLRIKRKDMAQQADLVEELVPIRLDVDWDKIKLRDTFTWNIHDRTIGMDLFAAQLVEDLDLGPPAVGPVMEQVQTQMREQLNDYYPHVYIEEDALDPELPYFAYKNEEMRILIKLNITIGPHTLVDKFEWEINNPLNSPEEFARSMVRELGIDSEFTTAIAHCIREQSQLFTRSLYIVGHPFDGRPLDDQDLIAAFLPSPISSTFRPQQQAKEYTPALYEVTEADLEKTEVIYSREQRRQKRSVNRRGGPTLPDLKDRQRTVRTLHVSSVIPSGADSVETSRLFKHVSKAGGKRPLRDGDLSESEESEDSSPDSPALNLQTGTARTRTMRGAAVTAQHRLVNIGRSETPEAVALHHHETRTSRRIGKDVREDSPEATTFIVKLKIGKEKLRKWARDTKLGNKPVTVGTPTLNRTQSATSTPAPGSMGPPSTPGNQTQPLPANIQTPQGQIGRVDAPPPPAPGQPAHAPPPPPQWLTAGLQSLHGQYPNDRFEGMMRYSAVNSATEVPCPAPPPGPIPDGVKWMYLPRIRCHDCPGKLYTPGPETTVGNFEIHLKNRQHREKVDLRVAAKGAAGAGSNTF